MPLALTELDGALASARERLLSCRGPDGHWLGELSSSAVSTAAAVCALALAGGSWHGSLVRGGLDWLARNANPDGGWGDSPASPGNLSATLLARAAFSAAGAEGSPCATVARAEALIVRQAGGLAPEAVAAALARRYGDDRTFSSPILAALALSGLWERPQLAWRLVAALPFELAACPHGLWKRLRLPVVSYALPALIAVGQARHHFRPPRNPLLRLLRDRLRERTLAVLEGIQPASGGFLEAAPLTAFVALCLAGTGRGGHPVVRAGLNFLTRSVRPDGSWPIDTNLATWVTTLSVNALSVCPAGAGLAEPDRRAIRDWLVAQQCRREHPYTHAAPGGWAWTDLSGGVPDADDTAGALLALRHLAPDDPGVRRAAADGVRWLLDLQNRDGGVPTFCRGWGRMPFDRSSPDLTAHALRAWSAWAGDLPDGLARRARSATVRAGAYLFGAQESDGSWAPLWFADPRADGEPNRVYGTARVLLALAEVPRDLVRQRAEMAAGGREYLLSVRCPDGGWGAGPVPSERSPAPPERSQGARTSIEETAVATEALAALLEAARTDPRLAQGDAHAAALREAVEGGARWLMERTEAGRRFPPAPIGLYFARLGYWERLYPVVFTVAALARVRRALHPAP